MPRTKTVTVYAFNELSEEAQERAIERLSDINVDHDWWESTFEDAERIGLKIEEYNNSPSMWRPTIKGQLTDLLDVCRNIRKEHGKETETFKTAKSYLKEYIGEFIKFRDKAKQDSDYSGWTNAELLEEFECEDEAQDITKEFEKALLEDYRILLEKEYEYQTSRGAIVESIKANKYEFLKNGKIA